MFPDHIDPLEWHQAVGIARQACARFFRDGGRPDDAMLAFGVRSGGSGQPDWAKAVDLIARVLCTPSLRRAA